MRRVVITGLGAISPHGLGAGVLWNALLEGKSSISALTRFDATGFPSQIAGTIPPFKTADFVPKSYRKATKIMARDIELAVVAADLAVRDARIVTKGVAEGSSPEQIEGWFRADPARMGCNIGAGLICADLDELTTALSQSRTADNTLDYVRWGKSDDPAKPSGMDNLTPLWLLKYLPNMLACHVSIIHDTQGPSNTITCGQASAGLALMEATRTIQRGHADLALAGGCESKVHPMGLMRWSLLHRLNSASNANPAAACRPYDKHATGAVIAEGGAVLMIEEYEHAKRRGATMYAELVGFGASASACESVVEPDATGEAPAAAIRKALKDGRIGPEQVGLVIPPGFGVAEWDRTDAAALKLALGGALGKTVVAPARGGIGDCGAGAQAIDIVAAAMALHQQTIPPTPNVTEPLEGMPICRVKTAKSFEYVLVLACALGGQNSAVVLKRI